MDIFIYQYIKFESRGIPGFNDTHDIVYARKLHFYMELCVYESVVKKRSQIMGHIKLCWITRKKMMRFSELLIKISNPNVGSFAYFIVCKIHEYVNAC